jgi:hypothetical protein
MRAFPRHFPDCWVIHCPAVHVYMHERGSEPSQARCFFLSKSAHFRQFDQNAQGGDLTNAGDRSQNGVGPGALGAFWNPCIDVLLDCLQLACQLFYPRFGLSLNEGKSLCLQPIYQTDAVLNKRSPRTE